jgi:hypothetical protein
MIGRETKGGFSDHTKKPLVFCVKKKDFLIIEEVLFGSGG